MGTADMMMEQITSAMSKFTRICYGDYSKREKSTEVAKLDEGTKAEYIKGLPDRLKGIEQFMKNRKFVTGNEISYADFNLYYLCVAHLKLDQHFFKPFPNLSAFYKAFDGLEGMKKWNACEYAKLPLNNT